MNEGKNYNKLSPQSGKDLANEFFKSLPELEGVETKIASLLQELYNAEKLTRGNIMEGLEKLREEKNEGD